jgi:hypothetical protein
MAKSFGTIYFSLNGEMISVRGEVTFNLSGGTKEFESNLDGTVHNKFMRAPKTAEISGISGVTTSLLRLTELFRTCSENGDGFTAVFDLTGECSTGGTTITFIDAVVGGQIVLAGSTGEISGLVIAAQNVRVTET